MKYKVATWIELLVTELWSNKKFIIENDSFDFNSYFNEVEGDDLIDPILREFINNIHSGVQENLYYTLSDVHILLRESRTKTAFAKALVPLLSNGAVTVTS